MPKVSIIIPAYNAAQTIARCLDSILRQKFTDFEVLVSDDGSTDGTVALVREFAARDPRIVLLENPHAGVSATRNTAIARARGDWLMFADCDDWLADNAIGLMVSAAEEHDAQLVIADFYRVVGDRISRKGDIGDTEVLTRNQYVSYMMEKPADFYYGVLWNKLYRRDIVHRNGLCMNPDVSWCEDFLFNLEYIRRAERFFALQIPVYHYVKTPGSLASAKGFAKMLRLKRTVFEYYSDFCRNMMDEGGEKGLLRVYKFLIDAASDGSASPSRKHTDNPHADLADLGDGAGILFERYRDRRLLAHFLAPVAKEHKLTENEAMLLLSLRRSAQTVRLADLSVLADIPPRALSDVIKSLSSKGLIEAREIRTPRGFGRKMNLQPTAAALPVTTALAEALNECERARLSGFSDEELAQYTYLSGKIKKNIRSVIEDAEK